jgi:hypothetical protein
MNEPIAFAEFAVISRFSAGKNLPRQCGPGTFGLSGG